VIKPSDIEQALTFLEIAGHSGVLSRSHLHRIAELNKLIPAVRPVVQEFLSKISQENKEALPPPKTILLVEDDSFDHSIEQILKGVGHTVLVALDPIKALPLFDQNEGIIDLVATDMNMDSMDGPQLVKAMNPKKKKLEALFMMNCPGKVIKPEDMPQEGKLIMKPFSPEQLVGAIRAIFEKTNTRASGKGLE